MGLAITMQALSQEHFLRQKFQKLKKKLLMREFAFLIFFESIDIKLIPPFLVKIQTRTNQILFFRHPTERTLVQRPRPVERSQSTLAHVLSSDQAEKFPPHSF